MAINIAINGFGRIGRLITRHILKSKSDTFRLMAINTLEPVTQALHLLKYDSNHGVFSKPLELAGGNLNSNGQNITFFNEPDPAKLPWRKLDIDIVIECSGKFTKADQARKHLTAGADKVIITAAAQEPDATLCLGVNHLTYTPDKHNIISSASCTTNCVAPAAKLINDNFVIKSSLTTFIHSYTNSQNLLDTSCCDLRRARAAGQSIMPTTTSAVHQVPEVIPALKGKFDGLAVRVPLPEVHLADFTAIVQHAPQLEEVHAIFERAAHEEFKGIVKLLRTPLVSIDMKGNRHSCVVDAHLTKIHGNMIKLLIWHDNEVSYCRRVLELATYIGAHLHDVILTVRE